METEQRIIELFDSTCIKQFESLGCDIAKVESQGHSEDVLRAYIDASSENMKVMLCLNVPRQLLLDTMPFDDGGGDDSLQVDWLLELSNRFLGRLKNKLVDHGCELKMGLPKFCVDTAMQASLKDKFTQASRYFEVNNKIMECCLFLDISSGAEQLSEYEDEDEDWFEESELEHLA
ncbi:MAG: hypothetical protein ACI84K_000292 [Pseudohongiellaceae bacterium]|jgi:hypothetical protein